jgi:hypothetical protein
MEWIPLNFNIMKNPLNWITVTFMVLIPLIVVALISEKLSPNS